MGQNLEVQNIKHWLKDQHASTLWDLSVWDSDKCWIDWKLSGHPPWLEEEAKTLAHLLQGKAPLNQTVCDKRGWGTKSGAYTTAEGYRSLLTVPYVAPNPIHWKFVWYIQSIPKVDLFCWNVAHNSILTAENLRKRGLEGPSICSLCKNKEENLDHLLITCPFSREVWRESLSLNHSNFSMPDLTVELFSNWAESSPFLLSKKALLKAAWMLIPKFIIWKLWLERNNRIFRNVENNPSMVALKARILLGDALDHKLGLSNLQPLDNKEINWLSTITPNAQNSPIARQPKLADWEIRLEEANFINWRCSLGIHCLFFDGASKGNPGPSGGGGVLLSPSGSTRHSYA